MALQTYIVHHRHFTKKLSLNYFRFSLISHYMLHLNSSKIYGNLRIFLGL